MSELKIDQIVLDTLAELGCDLPTSDCYMTRALGLFLEDRRQVQTLAVASNDFVNERLNQQRPKDEKLARKGLERQLVFLTRWFIECLAVGQLTGPNEWNEGLHTPDEDGDYRYIVWGEDSKSGDDEGSISFTDNPKAIPAIASEETEGDEFFVADLSQLGPKAVCDAPTDRKKLAAWLKKMGE